MSAPLYAVFGLFIALGLIAYVCERKTRNRPKRMATQVPKPSMWARFVRWVSKRRELRDLGWKRGWDHIRG